jgi:hypothetical protein
MGLTCSRHTLTPYGMGKHVEMSRINLTIRKKINNK